MRSRRRKEPAELQVAVVGTMEAFENHDGKRSGRKRKHETSCHISTLHGDWTLTSDSEVQRDHSFLTLPTMDNAISTALSSPPDVSHSSPPKDFAIPEELNDGPDARPNYDPSQLVINVSLKDRSAIPPPSSLKITSAHTWYPKSH